MKKIIVSVDCDKTVSIDSTSSEIVYGKKFEYDADGNGWVVQNNTLQVGKSSAIWGNHFMDPVFLEVPISKLNYICVEEVPDNEDHAEPEQPEFYDDDEINWGGDRDWNGDIK